MPRFTIFSINDNDLHELIESLTALNTEVETASSINPDPAKFKNDSTEWFFTEAPIIMQQAFSTAYRQYVEAEEKQHNAKPVITVDHVIDFNRAALMTLKTALQQKIAAVVAAKSDSFERIYLEYINKALSHREFYEVKAVAYTRLNEFLDGGPNKSRMVSEVREMWFNIMSKAKTEAIEIGNTDLANKIQDQLLISHEWTQYWESKQPKPTQASSATIFNPGSNTRRRDPDNQPRKFQVVSSRR